MKRTLDQKNSPVVYQTKSGAIELKKDIANETVWATQAQIADIFGIERSVATKHIGNLFRSKEMGEKSNVQKMHIASADKPISYYSLDIILAVGYRANSIRAIEFRKWVTKVLRAHITQGFTINPSVIAAHYEEFMKSVDDLKALLPAGDLVDHGSVLELVRTFATTWFSIDAYDRDALPTKGTTKKAAAFTADELGTALHEFKAALVEKGQATDLFGTPRTEGAVKGIVGNVLQSFGGKPVYPTVEEKAAHLLYFLVKNHPFVDGNKRSGAFAFVWFLRRAKKLDLTRLSPEALTALTLLIAESNPRDKQKMIGLVCRLLA